jgi:Zn-dependent protease with chaperone function
MRGGGKRNLLLGIGAISGLSQGQFAAILAHEYGHFSNRDTAGGYLAHQVYASFNQMAQRLIRSGVARFYNPAWLFLVGYQRIFLKVTLGPRVCRRYLPTDTLLWPMVVRISSIG